jgi:hypothetical protein
MSPPPFIASPELDAPVRDEMRGESARAQRVPVSVGPTGRSLSYGTGSRLTTELAERQTKPRVVVISGNAALAGAPSNERSARPQWSDEQRELRALLNRLEDFELPGDVGRMIYLAIENATDEREQLAAGDVRAVGRSRTVMPGLKRLLAALLPAMRVP